MNLVRHGSAKAMPQLACLLVTVLVDAQGGFIPAGVREDLALVHTLSILWPAALFTTCFAIAAWDKAIPGHRRIPGIFFILGYIAATAGCALMSLGASVPPAAIVLCTGISAISLAGLLVNRIRLLIRPNSEASEQSIVLAIILVTTLVIVLSLLPTEASFAITQVLTIASCADLLVPTSLGSARETEGSASDVSRKRDRLSKRCALLGQCYQLSEREAQIAEMIARGKTAQRIAEDLGISQNTVRAHSKHIYAKLGVHKKQDLLDIIDLFDADIAPKQAHEKATQGTLP